MKPFGAITNGSIVLNEWGTMVEACWQAIPQHFSTVILDEFVIMPDHFHGIVQLTDPCPKQRTRNTEYLPVVIGSFKAGVTRLMRRSGLLDFRWQKSFHDRIVRDDNELNRIRRYIRDNPLQAQITADADDFLLWYKQTGEDLI